MSRIVSFGMAIPPRPPLSPAKMAAIRRAKEAQRGREVRGERNGASKLTGCQVRRIRELYAAGVRPVTLAARFAVNRTLIWYIATRRIWTHI